MGRKSVSLALFDFDGTITRCETISQFLMFSIGRTAFFSKMFPLLPYVLAYAVGWIDNNKVKEKIFFRCLRGLSLDKIQKDATVFARTVLPNLLRPRAIERINWHKRRGDVVVVVSASIRFYVEEWAKELGVDDVIAVDLEEEGGVLTGRIIGKNCFGEEKVRRIKERFDIDSFDRIYAYGDSKGDREMLLLADEAYFRPFRK